MDYDCTAIYNNIEYFSFDWETLNVTFGSAEDASSPPVIQGPSSGRAKSEYIYIFSSVDAQDGDVYFSVCWGDGTINEWIGPVDSNKEIEINHAWERRGDYLINAKAKDTNGAESFTSTLEISMPRTKTFQDPSFNAFPFFSYRFNFFSLIYEYMSLGCCTIKCCIR